MGAQNFEQQITFYHNIFVYCAIAALVFLAIAVILFFVLKIPRVIGEFTGRDAKKAIQEMTKANDNTGNRIPHIPAVLVRKVNRCRLGQRFQIRQPVRVWKWDRV